MYVDINNFNTQPVVLIMYPAGSSGEFFCHALTDSILDITKTHTEWENQSRVKYSDYFGRSLNSGDDVIDVNTVIKRINEYFNFYSTQLGSLHVGMMHPNVSSIKFVETYFANCPVIEITKNSELSQKFESTSRKIKIEKPANPHRFKQIKHNMYGEYHAVRHLKIEWSDLMLNKTSDTFAQVTDFLKVTGDIDKFTSTVQEYLHRNKPIIDQLNER